MRSGKGKVKKKRRSSAMKQKLDVGKRVTIDLLKGDAAVLNGTLGTVLKYSE